MKAAVYRHCGGPEALHYETVPDPTPGADQLLIRVKAISVEGGDLLTRAQVDPGGKARVPGYAAAGEVVAVGSAVQGFRTGQKVTSFAFDGSHAELRAAPAATCWAVPDGLDIAVAAAVPCGAGTAALALDQAGLAAGQTVLVQGAAGGVGIAAVQLARQAGALVIGTGTSAETLEQLRPLGLDHAIVVDGGSLSEKVATLTGGGGADLLIDNVGGAALIEGIAALKDGGRAVLVGLLGGAPVPIDPVHLLTRRKSVIGCLLGAVMHEPRIYALIARLLEQAAAGRLAVPLDRSYGLADAAAAHARAAERGRIGRVIITP